MSIFEIAAFGIGVIGLGIATYTDLKERIVEDYISYGLIAAGLLLHLIQSILMHDWSLLLQSIGVGAITLVAGYLLWRFGFWAGGDVKLFTGIATLLPTFPQLIQSTPNPTPLFPLAVFVFSVFAMLPVGLALAAYRLKERAQARATILEKTKKELGPNLFFAAAASGLVHFPFTLPFQSIVAIVGILLFIVLPKKTKPFIGIGLLLLATWFSGITPIALWLETWIFLIVAGLVFKVAFSKELFRTPKSVSKLEEGDIVGLTIIEQNGEIQIQNDSDMKTIINHLKTQNTKENSTILCASWRANGLEKDEITRLQELAQQGKIPQQIPVKESAPFVPAIGVGFLVASLVGELVLKMVWP